MSTGRARAGFEVVSAGKGTRYHPTFHQSTPDTVWDNFGLPPEVVAKGGMNPKMFNSFIDGTKSGIEMTAVCNATGLTPQPDGLSFPPSSVYDLAKICKPKSSGGKLAITGTTEVVSSLHRDKSRRREPSAGRHLRGGQMRARVRAALRAGIQHAARRDVRAHGAVSADPHDRARARHLGRERGAAQGADRRAERLPLRCGGDREEAR